MDGNVGMAGNIFVYLRVAQKWQDCYVESWIGTDLYVKPDKPEKTSSRCDWSYFSTQYRQEFFYLQT